MVAAALLVSGVPSTPAQARSGASKPASTKAAEAKQSREALDKATAEWKSSLNELETLYKADIEKAEQRAKDLQSLYEQGIVSKREIEQFHTHAAEVQVKLDDLHRQMKEADFLISELDDLDETLERQGKIATRYQTQTAAYIRYSGSGGWSLASAPVVQQYFQTKFGRSLPIGAYGQSSLHNRWGLDHSNAMDVGLHPDSAEGQALIAWLQSNGIPFTAFRHAIPGSATGPHIHVGMPSHRIAPRS